MGRRSENRARAHSPGGWGQVADAYDHDRYAKRLPPRRGRRRLCDCGCGGPTTHAGMANGGVLVSGCELSMQRWVRNPRAQLLPDRIVRQINEAISAGHTFLVPRLVRLLAEQDLPRAQEIARSFGGAR